MGNISKEIFSGIHMKLFYELIKQIYFQDRD
jgi:hypothetical protein